MTDAQAGEGSSMDRMLGLTVIVILYVVIGLMAAVGAIFIARKILAPKAEQIFNAMFLIMIAAFYLETAVMANENRLAIPQRNSASRN
jgi:hypothetical protein